MSESLEPHDIAKFVERLDAARILSFGGQPSDSEIFGDHVVIAAISEPENRPVLLKYTVSDLERFFARVERMIADPGHENITDFDSAFEWVFYEEDFFDG